MPKEEQRRRSFDTHLRLDPDLAERVKALAARTGLSSTWIINRALRDRLDHLEQSFPEHG